MNKFNSTSLILVLLCIYIKRIEARPRPTILDDDYLESQMAFEGQTDFDLTCPYQNAIKLKHSSKTVNPEYLHNLTQHIINKLEVTWYKNGKPFHRENGNLVLDPDASRRQKTLIGVGISDAGRYTCYLNYSNVPEEAFKYFRLHKSLTFDLVIETPSAIMPDRKPTISHPPSDLIVPSGATVTFTCNKIETLTHQTTNWFKSHSLNQDPSEDAFMKAYNATRDTGAISPIKPYIILNENFDELKISNVSADDVGYYGCLVRNGQGIDIRRAKLELLDHFIEQAHGFKTTMSTLTGSSIMGAEQIISSNSIANGNFRAYSLVVNGTLDQQIIGNPSMLKGHNGPSFTADTMASSHSPETSRHLSVLYSGAGLVIVVLCAFIVFRKVMFKRQKKTDPAEVNSARQHLPDGNCPDIYNIGKTIDGFISGHLHQKDGHILSQSICSQVLNKENNPSISSNTNSDEASSWGKSISSNGDNCRAFYLPTSDTTATTVPMYDHPPSTGASVRHISGAIFQNACVINPSYGFLRSDTTDWLFPRRNLERLDKIGQGEFGEVWRFIARQKDGNESLVAVKQVRAGLGDRERLAFFDEIEIMKLVNNHPNVIKLLSYCSDEREPLLLIMEYAENGKLKTYLRSFMNSYDRYVEPRLSITSKELLKFSYHIAHGMDYVSSKGIIHRDLAARNILVSKDNVCKVADFGFARQVHGDCAYERTTTQPVPIRWWAPEALHGNKFTSKSDVFAFGVLMWEIVTLGAEPYGNLDHTRVMEKVKAGGRLDRPPHCRDELYQVMKKCWDQDPAKRPTFREVAGELEMLLVSENDYIELDQCPDHAYYNILAATEVKQNEIEVPIDSTAPEAKKELV